MRLPQCFFHARENRQSDTWHVPGAKPWRSRKRIKRDGDNNVNISPTCLSPRLSLPWRQSGNEITRFVHPTRGAPAAAVASPLTLLIWRLGGCHQYARVLGSVWWHNNFWCRSLVHCGEGSYPRQLVSLSLSLSLTLSWSTRSPQWKSLTIMILSSTSA